MCSLHGSRRLDRRRRRNRPEARLRRFTGLSLADAATADVQNNQVFTGNTANVIADTAHALDAKRIGTLVVAQNTLALGPTLTGDGGVAIVSATSATVANNLFIAAGGFVDYAVRVDSCKDAKVTAFRNNVWAGFPDGKPLLGIDTPGQNPNICTEAATTAATASAAEDALRSGLAGTAVANNIAVACAGDCLFGAWNEKTANDLLISGWRLAASAPCSIVKSSGDVGGLLSIDAYGTTRTDPRSIGASESDAACQ